MLLSIFTVFTLLIAALIGAKTAVALSEAGLEVCEGVGVKAEISGCDVDDMEVEVY
jgi:hypothetical protein